MLNANDVRRKLALAWATEMFHQTYHADSSRRPNREEMEESLSYFRELYEEGLGIYMGYPDDDFTLNM